MNFNFNKHPELDGLHATLSPSSYPWIRYDDEKMLEVFMNKLAAQRGTELHAFAAEAIRLNIPLKGTSQTLNMYVNDALGYRMIGEQLLFATPYAFGTADAISYRKERGHDLPLLRIHDLKTGTSKASVNQLEIYAAYFCIEYDLKPHQMDMELRIYQNDYRQIYIPDPDDIVHIMDKTIHFSRLLEQARLEAAA